MRRRLALTGVLAMGMALAMAPAVGAAAPWTETLDRTDSYTYDAGSLCPFAVEVDYHMAGWTTYFAANDGTPVKKIEHITESDIVSANGVTLVGMPYVYSVYFAVDSDFNLTRVNASGELFRVLLPDGGLFISAGHVTFDGQVGNWGKVDALCAALAGD